MNVNAWMIIANSLLSLALLALTVFNGVSFARLLGKVLGRVSGLEERADAIEATCAQNGMPVARNLVGRMRRGGDLIQ